MPSSIRVPRTIGAAERKLNELGEIATATEWQRAAIVATFVDPDHGSGGRQEVADTRHLESARAFARRGIVGLSHHETVLIYARAWLDRFERPGIGRSVPMPEEGWPPTALEDDRYQAVEDRDAIIEQAAIDGTGASKAVDIAKNTRAMSAAIVASPAVARAARAALARRELPEAPFSEPPDAYPGAESDGMRMDVQRDVAHLHEAIRRVERWTRDNRELVETFADRLDQEAELLHMVASAARGVRDDELEGLLQ